MNALETIPHKIVLTGFQIFGLRLHQNDLTLRPLLLEPRRIVPPIGTQLDHRGIIRQPFEDFLKYELFQWLMDAAVDDQELAERTVIGARPCDRHAQSIVKVDLIALEKAGHRDPLDKQVQGIGYGPRESGRENRRTWP
jgi:hypothetical protein